MSSNKSMSFILLLIIASLISITILLIRNTMRFNCSQSDEKVCAFLQKYSSLKNQPTEGTYSMNNADYIISWKRNEENRTITATKNEEITLDVIIMNNFIYLKDLTDNTWWKQSLSDSAYNKSYLPFDPTVFFNDLNDSLFANKTTFKDIGKEKCGDKTCIKYEINSSKQKSDRTRILYVSSENELYKVTDTINSSLHEIMIMPSTGTISEPEKIKLASRGQNIFLDYITRQEQQREKDLDYLKQFQQDQEKAEKLQNVSIKLVEPTKTASSSAN